MYPQGEMMKREVFLKRITALFILVFSLVFITSAQTDQGKIAGRVADSNGAIIPGSTVTVTNQQTGESRSVTVNDDGTFRIAALKPSKYTITTSAANFEKSTKRDLELLVGQELN